MTAVSIRKFWDWSLTHYECDGVEPVLLRLQDEDQLDANILLWACWCATSFNALPISLVRDAIAQTTPWTTHVTIPLRKARRALKTMGVADGIIGTDALRASIKQNELSAEKIEQELLEGLATTALQPVKVEACQVRSRAFENLSTYARLVRPQGNSEYPNPLLESLTRHIFADTSQEMCSKDDHGE